MTEGSESMQVLYMEIEGIKIAIQLAKDAVRIAWQLAKFLFCIIKNELRDAKYKKVKGKTNIKNLLARANGQALIPSIMDKETYAAFKKMAPRMGILYHAFPSLKTGKDGYVQVMFAEKDLAMFQEFLSQVKENKLREDARNGMTEEKAAQDFEEGNRTETMEEFAANAGINVPEEVFEEAMREQFGENYEEELGVKEELKKAFKERDGKGVEELADVIDFKERAAKLKKKSTSEIQFVHDEERGESQIVEETETHVKVGGKGLAGDKDEWSCVWIPKESIVPPLDKQVDEKGIRTAKLKKDQDIIVEDPTGRNGSVSMKSEEFAYRKEQNIGIFADEGSKYRTSTKQKNASQLDITISKELIYGENDRAVKTRVPGTWGKDVRFLWTDKADILDAYGGKSMLTTLDRDKDYKLYSQDDRVLQTIKGGELYRGHYDAVEERVGKRARAAVGNNPEKQVAKIMGPAKTARGRSM